ncbi:hypothetical protein [Mesorhizobium sp. M1E.F.Ca.ET.063.01.1.1]|uniref:hypothetical protein n=1 Tax=Mesorhizobium sp. M1E.F.Ca.ET.063.01.1.1 TaxID=2496750 RepID=UPI000FC99CF1|nr:hypothetical protein [Mesorhizobium sp. M1E.F.Ca.ET.063.01.1.1]RUW85194.1 hypothetical protein EOA29_05935 [Mesorhizobium sp. M1E.F.Ca.ET.063.01.1.1]
MTDLPDNSDFPEGARGGKAVRGALNVVSGAIPFAGGLLAAAAAAWSEKEQDRINAFLRHWMQMLSEEMKEKEETILQIMSRVDMTDEDVAKRVESPEYQSILKKSFRDWAGTESKEKRVLLRNLLANAASIKMVNDDVVRLFLEWIKTYSELHFAVVAKIYNAQGITRGEVWTSLGRERVREDSADADLFKLLFRDLSTGGIVRQHRETDWQGNYVKKSPHRAKPGHGSRQMVSAFDDGEQYELTALGQQFVHYAMTDVPVKLEFNKGDIDVP